MKYLAWAIILMALVITLSPIVWVVLLSLKNPAQVQQPNVIVPQVTFQNYDALSSGNFFRYLLNSVGVSSATAVLVMLLSMIGSYSLSRFNTGGRTMVLWVVSNFFAPPVAFLLPIFLTFSFLGLVNTYWGLILVYVGINLPICVWLTKGFLDAIPKYYEEAAFTEGASMLQSLTRVLMPMMKPAMSATAALAFFFSWTDFTLASILTSGSISTWPVGTELYATIFRIEYGPLAAAVVLGLIPSLALVVYIQRYLVTGLTFGAVKG